MAKPERHRTKRFTNPDAHRIERDHHSISRRNISDNALKVMKRLSLAGYEAFLVGGAVRDMMLDKHPKDFDVATNATPEEIRKLFKNARIIGRRFRIVHVLFGREIIEVTTFRGHHDAIDKNNCNNSSVTNEDGMLLRDNVFGSIEEDALRRDFSVNALYYSSKDFCVYDFANGVSDINNKIIRLIGDSDARFKEDPVRILRAIRFAAKLNFTIIKSTEVLITADAELLKNIPPARLFDEFLKLFVSGYALETYYQLKKYNLLPYLIHSNDLITNNIQNEKFIIQALSNTDDRIRIGKSITPAFIYAIFLWPSLCKIKTNLEKDGLPSLAATHTSAHIVLQQQASITSIPKRIQITIKEIWELQTRLNNRTGGRALKMLEHPRFRAAYDFLLLREQVGEIASGLGEWWTQFQNQNDTEKDQSIKQLFVSTDDKRKQKPRKRKPRPIS